MARTQRVNLSTKPFYNDRGVHLVLGLAAVAVLVFTVFNLWQVYVLSGRQAAVQARLSRAETQARQLREQAAAVRRAINPKELEATVAAAREANLLIERRVFSWTEVLNQFETTLPPTVRISSVRPRVERDGTMRVEVVVLARTVEAVDAFIENLEKRGAFSRVLSREEFVNEDGLIQASLEGQYRATEPPAAAKEGRP
jgi:Tfp pilus assembly protein PilN